MSRYNILIIISLFFLIFAARLLPHLPNFTPVSAVAMIAGAYLSKKWALLLPVIALFISDYFLGFYDWKLMISVYGSFALVGVFSWWLKKSKTASSIFIFSIFASLFFFFTTNITVWYFSEWYSKDIAGLLYCLQLAVPFLRNSILGNLFYSFALFGSAEAVIKYGKYACIKKEKLAFILKLTMAKIYS